MSKFWVFILTCFTSINLFAQDQFGMAQSNYSPTSTVFHNPSSIVDSKVWMDFHLGGGAAFIYNDYGYLPGKAYSFGNFVATQELPLMSFDNSRSSYKAYGSVDYQSLSGSMQIKDYGIGFSVRVRGFLDIRNIPKLFAYGLELDYLESEDKELDKTLLFRDLTAEQIKISYLLCEEFALTYAKAVYHRDKNLLVLGGSLKFLGAFMGGGVKIDQMNYAVDTTGLLNYNSMNISSYSAEMNPSAGIGGYFPGRGLAMDIGFTFKKMLYNVTYYSPYSKVSGRKPYDYKYKVGLSLIDFGSISFSGSSKFSSATSSSGTLGSEEFEKIIYAPNEFVLNDIDSYTNLDTSGQFTIWMPTALVLQYDYNTQRKLRFSTQYTHGFARKNNMSIQRPSVFVFTPRFESKWFELSFPFALYDFQEIRTGVMVRIAWLTLGTDKLGTFLSLTNATGYDFYCHLAVKIHKKKPARSSFR